MAIRAPWAVYEDDSGVSVTGNGPNLSAWTGQPAIVGDGFAPSDFASVASAPGINMGQDFSLGLFREVTADSFINGAESFSNVLRARDGTNGFALALLNPEEQNVVRFSIQGGPFMFDLVEVFLTDLPIGWHHFGISKSSGAASLFVDGVLVAGPTAVIANAGAAGIAVDCANFENGGITTQPVIASVAYTAEEWAYIYNGGAGRLYSSWNIAP